MLALLPPNAFYRDVFIWAAMSGLERAQRRFVPGRSSGQVAAQADRVHGAVSIYAVVEIAFHLPFPVTKDGARLRQPSHILIS